MAKPTMVLTGDKALNRKLKKLAGKEAKAVIRKATRPALKPVLQEARAEAPKRTGNLRKNIKIRALPRSRKFFGSRVTSGAGKSENSGDAFYGAFLEYGTKRGIEPRRFMKRAAEKKRSQALSIYKQEVGNNITKLGRNG